MTALQKPDFDPYFVESTPTTSSFAPGSITRNIIQDRKGNIWLATWEGIIQYDGETFTNFTNKDGLRRFHVFSVLEDSSGMLWFGTIGAGVYRYDGNRFLNLTSKEGLVHDKMGCFYEDKAGKIWIGTMGGISVYNPALKEQKIVFSNFTTKEGLTSNDINSIVEDQEGKIWIGARGEACTYDGENFTKLLRKDGQPFINVRSIIQDTQGNIWIGGNDGLWRYDGSEYTHYATNFTGYIYEDSKGNIWTSSESPDDRQEWMLSKYNAEYLHDEKVEPTVLMKKADMFFGIMEDKDGNIWLGTLDGVCRYDGNAFHYFSEMEINK
jgi:ligand-binding sensor domain-containing protein